MGYSSNWIAFHGLATEEVHQRLGLASTDLWVGSPVEAFVGRSLSHGRYLVVEDRSEEEVADTWDLGELSRGGGLWAVTEVDGAGYAYLSGWRDGEQQCQVSSLDGEWSQEGELPAAFDTEVDELRAAEAAGAEIDAMNLILSIAERLTEYQCGTGSLDERPFELLAPTQQATVIHHFRAAVTDALGIRGFAPIEPNGGICSLWFVAPTPLTGVQVALEVDVDVAVSAGVRFSWKAYLLSQSVTEFLRALPATVELLDPDRYSRVVSIAELRAYPDQSLVIVDPNQIADGVGQFIEFVDGPLADWRASRTTRAELVAAAKQPQGRPWGMGINSRLAQSVAVLCALQGDSAIAADLMAWFLTTYEFSNDRMRHEAENFDQAVRERIPAYRAART
ncbi:hypothetical protein [Nocardia heshunensis]